MRLLLETERKKRKRGANGNDSFLNRLIQGACIAHRQSSVKLLDFPRLCKHEGKSLYVVASLCATVGPLVCNSHGFKHLSVSRNLLSPRFLLI